MHLSLALAALVGLSSAVAVPRPAPQLYKIQLAPDDIRTVTEEEKWALRAVSLHAKAPFF